MSNEQYQVGMYLKSITQKSNNETTAADGGNAVAPNLVTDVMSQLGSKGTVWNKVKKYKVLRGPTVKIPGRVNTLANEPSTGIRSYWTTESQQSVASAILYSATTVDLGKLVTRVPATMELVQDAPAFAQQFVEDATESIIYKVEREILLGVGSAIKGVTGSNTSATVEVSMSADITEAEMVTAIDKLHPMAYENAEWYVTPQQYTNILMINYTNETSLVFEDGVYYLFGFPVRVTPQLVASPYHVILGDFTKFAVTYIEPKFDTSEEIRFLEGEQEFRLQMRIGGSTFAQNSVLDDGNTYGFFVVSGSIPAYESSSSSSSSSESSESVGNESSSSSSERISSNSSSSSYVEGDNSSSSSESTSSESWDD